MKSEESNKKVLVVGASGFLGKKILKNLEKESGLSIRALSRKERKPSENSKIEWVIGDMLDRDSLTSALDGIDIVISSANGYMKENLNADLVGNKNLIEIAKIKNIKKFIFISIVACEHSPEVPHFHAKKISEDLLISSGIPYISLRAPAFLDQENDYIADAVKKGKFYGVGDASTQWSYVYTEDIASYVAKATIHPKEDILNTIIDLGWKDGPRSQEELKELISSITNKKLSLTIVPWFLLELMVYPVRIFSELGYDFLKMFLFFRKGKFISNIKNQEKFFGDAPSSEDAVRRWAKNAQLI
jgi:uncharacterized protein YbjT (DUF2867 family)